MEGSQVASRGIIDAATRAKIDSRIISVEDGINDGNQRNWTIIHSKINPRFFLSIFWAIDDLLSSTNIASLAKFSDSDLIHVLNITKEAYVTAHSLMRVKKPLLMHFFHSPHNLSDDVFLVRKIAMRAGMYGHLLGNHVLTTTIEMFRFFTSTLKVDSQYVHYAPYPVDTNRFQPIHNRDNLRINHNLPIDRPIIAFVGSLQPERGIFVLMKAFQHVSKAFPKALLLISHPQRRGENIYEKALFDLIRSLSLEKNVLVKGPSSNVEEIYNLADAVVLPLVRPYWVDPPLVLLEAMSSGSAVVTTPVCGIIETVCNREDILLAKPNNAISLSEAILELLHNPDEASKIGQQARQKIVQKYSYDAVGKNLLKVYNSVLNEKN